MSYRLTKEGALYLEKGLPEVRLANFLWEKGSADFDSAKNNVENFAVAIDWAKKNGWIKVEEGKLKPVKKPSDYPLSDALERLGRGESVDEQLANTLLHRKLVEEAKEGLKERAAKMSGLEVTHLTPELIASGAWREVRFKPYNVGVVGEKSVPGKRQPYGRFLRQVKRKLVALGFREATGPLVETEFWNFDALFQPQMHPARDWTDTYQLKEPKSGNLPHKDIAERVRKAHERSWKYPWNPVKAAQLMPRAHTTAVSARMLPKAEIPGKYFTIGRCFRPDVLDATHLIEFNQVEGIVLDPSLTFRNLLGVLQMFAREIAGAEEVRFMPDYYPFTEPSVQMSAKHPELGWVEFGGAGIFREELTAALGVTVPVIAWGIGIDRLAMFKLGIKDIRYLFATDLKWLREAPVV
jgi:phenylalanyl-tRNA synthetase alpha chain